MAVEGKKDFEKRKVLRQEWTILLSRVDAAGIATLSVEDCFV